MITTELFQETFGPVNFRINLALAFEKRTTSCSPQCLRPNSPRTPLACSRSSPPLEVSSDTPAPAPFRPLPRVFRWARCTCSVSCGCGISNRTAKSWDCWHRRFWAERQYHEQFGSGNQYRLP
ncbi:hypothetical protein VTN31DRAFT_431 [Thermomyces dupontii]|uniref:uncharacterized protein n=1 Tax=Talaromyces thermophilus TaxID=28565 RepID=UPI0037444B9E